MKQTILFISISALTTSNEHDDRINSIINFCTDWDLNALMSESFFRPLVAFVFLKFVEVLFGEKVKHIVNQICIKLRLKKK